MEKEEPINSCKQSKLVHAWHDITPNIVYPTNPPQYLNKEEQCRNCGLVRTFKSRTENWTEYELREKPHNIDFDSITVANNLIDMSGSGTTTLKNVPFTNTI